jgi:hypothetical protein
MQQLIDLTAVMDIASTLSKEQQQRLGSRWMTYGHQWYSHQQFNTATIHLGICSLSCHCMQQLIDLTAAMDIASTCIVRGTAAPAGILMGD